MAGVPVHVLSEGPLHLRGIDEAMASVVCSKDVLFYTFDVSKTSATNRTCVASYASSDLMLFGV